MYISHKLIYTTRYFKLCSFARLPGIIVTSGEWRHKRIQRASQDVYGLCAN